MSGISCAFTGQVKRAPQLRQSPRGRSWCRIDATVGEGPDMQDIGGLGFAGRAAGSTPSSAKAIRSEPRAPYLCGVGEAGTTRRVLDRAGMELLPEAAGVGDERSWSNGGPHG